MLLANAAGWQPVLTGPADPRQRPAADVWSLLEYACHVRDVFRLYGRRLQLMLTQYEPHYPDWDQNAAVHDPVHHLCDVTGRKHAGPGT